MPLQIGIALAAAAGVGVVRFALGEARVGVGSLSVLVTFAGTLLFVILVAAGKPIHRGRPGPGPCQIISPTVTRPAKCRPALRGRPASIAGSEIRLRNGHRLPIVTGSLRSSVDTSVRGGTGFRPTAEILGWAADTRAGHPVDAILVFVSGRYAGAVAPTLSRPDVAQTFHQPGIRQSGFRMEVPLPLSGAARLQLIMIARGVASRLPFDCTGAIAQVGC